MYCTSCGKQIADDVLFCPYCGTPVPQSDDELSKVVAAARSGDQDAISALYEKTYSKVYYTVKSMIKDEDAVFDIVQDTYIKAFAHLDRFRGDTKFLPWVRQIAANTARDWLKKKRPMLFAELSSGDGQDTPVEELLPDERIENLPEEAIDREETKRLISEIIEDLPEDQRAAIGMFYYEEMSVKEIAAAMGVSESAVKSRLMYGRNKIEKKILELEKQGTKLYSLAPIPFLLLLFRSQEAHAAEAPNSQILQNILASQPTGAATAAKTAQNAGTTGAAAGTEATGAVIAGTAAAAGSLVALKLGLIGLGAVAVVGLGVFGVTQIASHSSETQEAAVIEEDVIDQETSEVAKETETSEETETPEEAEAQQEPTPIDEALEQYRIIIGQADSYEYETFPNLEMVGYRYALVQMQSDDPVPTLLLEKQEKNEQTFMIHMHVFQYDPDTKIVHQPDEWIMSGPNDGDFYDTLAMAGDGDGMMQMERFIGSGRTTVSRIILDGDSLNQEVCWAGQFDLMPDSLTFIEIEWHEIGDLSALDSWTAPDLSEVALSDPVNEDALPTDGDRIVLTGTVGRCDYHGIIALQGQPDPNNREQFLKIFRVIILDTPQTLRLLQSGGEEDGYFSNEALMISIDDADDMDQYMSQHITFSIDPANTYWPNDTLLPLGQPRTADIHVLD